MRGKILIVDAIATNRVMLKVKLGTAFYTVLQAASQTEAICAVKEHQPSLVISALDLPDGDAAHLREEMSLISVAAHIPVMALATDNSPAERITAIEAGVRDVLSRSVDDILLLSRVRGLIRSYHAEQEWQMREDTSRALGLAEDSTEFAAQPHCALVSADTAQLSRFALQLRATLRAKVSVTRTTDLLTYTPKEALPDAYVLVLSADPGAAQQDLHLLSALKSSENTRHSGIVVLQTSPNPALGAHALDLGADDLMSDGFDATELALRLNAVIRRKRMAAQVRATVRTGLQAAVFDPLTGLHNRRYAMPHLERVVAHAGNTGRTFAVLIADLDHFKRVNDIYGHAAGDAVLIEVANRLRRTLRSSDMIARIGGEEFMIVMPTTSEDEARKVALRLCSAISGTPFTIPGHAAPIHITISIGMVLQLQDGTTESAADILDRADKALYASKGGGRNQVTFDRPAA